jgi:hypothetical protein
METKNDINTSHLNDHQTAIYVDYLLNEKSSKPTENILNHVESCPICKDNILDVFLCLKNSRSLQKQRPFKDMIPELTIEKSPGKQYTYLKRIAASFFFMALFLTFYFTIIDRHLFQNKIDLKGNSASISNPASQNSHTSIKSLPRTENIKPSQTEKRSVEDSQNKNFAINPNLEYMINSQFRNETIKVNSPANNSTLIDNIIFAWESFTDKPSQLKILSNHNEVIFEYTIQANQFVLKEILPPGLYYWKLENQTDLLYVGKFFIENDITAQPE